MNFCKLYNRIMAKLNECNEPVSEINIFIGIAEIIYYGAFAILVHIMIGIIFVYSLLEDYLLRPIENKIHIYKKIISPIYGELDLVIENIKENIKDTIYRLTTSVCKNEKN